MSVPNQTPYIIYNANGLTTVFPFEFYIINSSDLQVTLNGEVLTSGYSVGGVGNVGGGDVTFSTPPANGTVVMLERVVPTYRLTDYQDNGDLLAYTVNKDFDRLWMAIQSSYIYLGLALRRPLLGGPFNAEGYRIEKLADPVNDQDAATKKYVESTSLARVLRVPESAIGLVPSATVRSNKLLAFNNNGDPIVVLPESGSAADVMVLLASDDGYKYIPSIQRIHSDVPVEMFRLPGMTDQQIVQAANDYAASVGRDLIFEEGITYQVESVTSTCKWIRPNLKRKPATTSNMVVISNGGSLKGGSVDGSADTLSTAANTIYVNSTSRFDIDGTRITNTPGHSIVVQDTPATFAPSRIKTTTILGGATSSSQASAGAGIYLYNALNVDIIDNDISKKANGILGQGNKRNSAKLNISGNRTYQNYGSGIGLVLISEAADQQAYEKVLITENHIFSNSGTGLAVQCDLTVVANNQVHGNGSETYHQGILVNANGVSVNSNIITNNAGVGIDFGDCRKCSATGNHIEENGWLGIEVNSCEQMTVTCNILNLNLKGKSDGPMQAAILVHKGNGGYPFLGDSKDITITGNSIRSGDGQRYAIFIADVNCYNITVSANACKLAGLLDDIVTVSGDVTIFGNNTRWDPLGSARASVSSGAISIPSVADTVQVNGTGSVITINIQNSGAYIKDRYVRIRSVNGMTLENSGGSGGNLFLGASIVLAAGDSVRLWSDGSGGWKKA
ncbi:TPA: phage tail fiber protein [Enterobacter roggenkampii]|uniref:phage tail fiber domain-containing protein n=1 Tax=Enterobacter roggenkampii TaxID=1812935 RepID=UPI000668EC7E|nr:phage tail fiber protein [Enterobacter roggenkampii]